MAVTSHIPLPPGDRFVALSESFLHACEGDKCAALVMWEFRFRTDKYGPGTWFEATVKGLVDSLFGEYGTTKIREALKKLKRLGFVECKSQPGRPPAFKVNLDVFGSVLKATPKSTGRASVTPSESVGVDPEGPPETASTPPEITPPPTELAGVETSAYIEPRVQRAKKNEEEQAAATELRERVGEPEPLPAAAGEVLVKIGDSEKVSKPAIDELPAAGREVLSKTTHLSNSIKPVAENSPQEVAGSLPPTDSDAWLESFDEARKFYPMMSRRGWTSSLEGARRESELVKPAEMAEGIRKHGAAVMAGGKGPGGLAIKVCDELAKGGSNKLTLSDGNQPAYLRDAEQLDMSSEPVDPDGWRDKVWLDMCQSLGPDAVADPEAAYRKFNGLPAAGPLLVEAAA